MQIDRTIIQEKLASFSQETHGVVIGDPGVGKSYLLSKLAQNLSDRNIIAFIVHIDATEDASDESIAREIGLSSGLNWIETLKRVSISDHKALLIFDAFDAARDERIRKGYLSQIKKAKNELSEKWNILASVRTYDAAKSEDLLELFPDISTSAVRSFHINVLSDGELEEAVKQSQYVNQVFVECSSELKQVLKTPYFLVLLDKLLRTTGKIEYLKAIKSETQLLATFWNRKVTHKSNGHLCESILSKLTSYLVGHKTLSCPINVYLDLINPSLTEAFEYLLSENILTKESINQSRLSYSHNILFDYAVSRLCISAKPNEIEDFILADRSRPFFLRPSFLYFFTQAWNEERTQFWNIYWHLYNSSLKEIRLLIKLVANTVITQNYTSVEDLKPLQNERDLKTEATKQLLQSMRFIRNKELSLVDVEFILRLSLNLKIEFLGDYTSLLEIAINSEIAKPIDERDHCILEKCGEAARNLFLFVIEHRSDPYVDRIGGIKGVEFVTKTYSTNIKESRILLEKVLDFLTTDDFNIWYFSDLTENVKYIMDYDIEFVSKIYKQIFLHEEKSESTTQMGSGVLMNLISNRRQDFDLCQYRLGTAFPKYLATNPISAIATGLQIINRHVELEEVMRFGIKSVTYPLKFRDIDCQFTSDGSAIWGDNFSYKRPYPILQAITEYLKQIARTRDKKAGSLCGTYFKEAKVAFLWKCFLELGIDYPKELLNELYTLILNPILLQSRDTSYEATEVIEKILPLLDTKQIENIERAVLSIFRSDYKEMGYIDMDSEQRAEYHEKIVARILAKFPFDLLQLKESKEFILSHKKVENEKPFVFTSSVEPFTPEIFYSEQGIDVKQDENAILLNESRNLESFRHVWINKTPGKNDYSDALISVTSLVDSIKKHETNADRKIVDTAWHAVAAVLSIISRNINSLNEEEFQYLKENIVFCFKYRTDHDEHFKDQSPATGYSSTPRIDASEALIPIFLRDDKEDTLELIVAATNDENAVVRLNVIKHLARLKSKNEEKYWSIILNRVEKENDYFVAGILVANVIVSENSAIKLEQFLNIASGREELFESANSFLTNFTRLLVWLYSNKNNTKARDILAENISKPVFCKAEIIAIFDHIDPSHNNYSTTTNLNSAIIERLANLVVFYGNEIKSHLETQSENKESDIIKSSLEIIDLIVQRLYFSLDLNERIRNRDRLPVLDDDRRAFYFKIKPILQQVIDSSREVNTKGLILAHTAHYFMEILSGVVKYDPRTALTMANSVTKLSIDTGYALDSLAIREVVVLTEKLLVDHRDLLIEDEPFNQLVELLEVYIKNGWPDALNLLWRLNDIFK